MKLEYLFLDGAHFGRIQGRRPSRCLPPGPSPLRAARCWWGWPPAPTRATTLGRLPRRTGRLRPAGAAAGDQRRRTRAHRRGRGGARSRCGSAGWCPAPASSWPGSPPRPGRGHGRVLADLRRPHRRPWPAGGRCGAPPGRGVRDRSGKRYPAAVAWLLESLPELTTFLPLPRERWQRIRHPNLIERTLGETRRRIKVLGRRPGERSC
jgi:mutator family transposase